MPALTATFCNKVAAPGKYPDGGLPHGLRLQVQVGRHVRKSWIQRVSVKGGARRELGLGTYPAVTLAEARAAALANYIEAKRGNDPRPATVKTNVPTLREALDAVVTAKERAGTWKPGSAQGTKWRRSLDNHAAHLGAMPVDAITTADVLATVGPLTEAQPDVARRLRQRLDAAFKWAKAQGLRTDNPAGDELTAVLPQPRKVAKHHDAVPHADVAGLLERLHASTMAPVGVALVEFVILTAARAGEARFATWSEIDFDAGVWTVPADRMKAGREHRVPLSAAALDVLHGRKCGLVVDPDAYIFPGANRGRPVGMSVTRSMQNAAETTATLHGFRSSFRDWAAETGVDGAVAEAALAHAKGSQVEAAYNRTDLLDARRPVMEAWAAYLDTTK